MKTKRDLQISKISACKGTTFFKPTIHYIKKIFHNKKKAQWI